MFMNKLEKCIVAVPFTMIFLQGLKLRISEDSFAEINLYQDGGVAGGIY